ncbi:hypothetical protein RIF29_45735 [Crotalaria pallida]|uniref:Uncharacterized protein n=1 Tax=Crotalaria pallida TaxID=3830 RepID=A0AAN9DVQ3_CROPI
MWSESRLAKRMRRYLMLPFACLPLAMRGVVHLIALCLANVSACEWRSGWLCCLAPCSWFGTSSMQPFSCTPCAGVPRCSLVVLVLPTHLAVSVCREDPFLPRPLVECRSCYPIGGGNICTSCIVVNGFYLVDPASSHMLVSKIKPCMFKKLVVGPWVGSIGPPMVCIGRLVPSAGDALLALTGRVVPLALRTTAKAFAKDVFINQERKLGARRRSDTVLVSTINDADQGSADVAFRTPLAPYEKSKSLGSGGSMVARLKLKGIDGRAPPGVEPAA